MEALFSAISIWLDFANIPMKMKRMFFPFTVAVLILYGCQKKEPAEVTTFSPQTEQPTVTIARAENEVFMELVNGHRILLGLRPLELHPELSKIAYQHSQSMAQGKVSFGHTGFSERCYLGRIALGGGNLCAENVATGQQTVSALFEAWMSSSGHRENLEQTRLTHTGLASERSVTGRVYWTQLLIEKL